MCGDRVGQEMVQPIEMLNERHFARDTHGAGAKPGELVGVTARVRDGIGERRRARRIAGRPDSR